MNSGKPSRPTSPAATCDIVAQILAVAQFLALIPMPVSAGLTLAPAGAKIARPRTLRSAS